MAGSVFSIPIFFIVFRETLEAAIIVSVLLGLVEQIVQRTDSPPPSTTAPAADDDEKGAAPPDTSAGDSAATRRLVKRLRWQIAFGAAAGFGVSLAIGAAFIAVWFTQASNLWAKSEELWEGIFSLIAALLIFVMGLGMLKMDRAHATWRAKLQHAFEGQSAKGGARAGKYVLFVLPFVTVLREGMEAVVFVGGVALGQPARAIPLAALTGILCGAVAGAAVYAFASRSSLSLFLVVMTNLILLIGAGLFSKAVGFFERHAFNTLLGAEVDDAGGDGPGSYDVRGNVWHLACCNPENRLDGSGWGIFAALFGWTNNASLGTVLAYIFYWLAVVAALVVLKFREGRTTLLGRESAQGRRRREARAADA